MTIEELKEVLYNATNGTYKMPGTTTLMGYIKEYDEKGREVTVDPNYLDYEINICGTNYKVTKHKWDVYIWKPEFQKANRTWLWKDNFEDYVLTVIDTKPDYVREYEAKKEAEFTEQKKELVENGEYICTLVDLDNTQYQLITYNNKFAVVEFAIERVTKVDCGDGVVCTKRTMLADQKWENVKSVKFIWDWELRHIYKCLSAYMNKFPKSNNITLMN